MSCTQVRDESVNPRGIRPALAHGAQVELEVANGLAPIREVALLAQHDLVNEAAQAGFPHWQPRGIETRQPALQRFQQGHEIPDRKDMVLHEPA